MLNPVHLRTLGVVLAVGSFADAARHLGYTPSAVSEQISRLERQLRLTLFERDAHTIRPTVAAQHVAALAVPALGALRMLDDDLRMLAGGTIGRLRIASFPTASERLLPIALSALRRQRPRVAVEVDEVEPQASMQLLASGEVDVALVYTYGTVMPRWARTQPLVQILEEDLLLISRPEGPGRHTETEPAVEDLGEFFEATWIATCEDTLGAANVDRLCRGSGFEPDIRYRSNNYGVIEGLVASGLGVAMVPALALGDLGVSVRGIKDAEATRRVWAVPAPTIPTELSEVFVAALRRAAARQQTPFVRVSSPGE